MRVRNHSSDALRSEPQGSSTAADHRRCVTSHETGKNTTLRNLVVSFVRGRFGAFCHTRAKIIVTATGAPFCLLLYHHFIGLDLAFSSPELKKTQVFLMGSVPLPLARHGLQKAPSLTDFILISRQALHQRLTSSPQGLAAACPPSQRCRAHPCRGCRSDAAGHRRMRLQFNF